MQTDWKHGYFAESGYTYGFYVETAPSRLHWVAALKGFKTPLEKFRYLDLGCGQGLSLIHMAALHPDSEFVGIDFMPEHIAHGRQLAQAAGLTNVTFIEGDFIALSKEAHKLGEFDFAVAHGITTWISPEVREGLFSLAGQTLKPGGVMYNSYNTYPGWLPAAPFQNLVLQLQTRYNGKQALEIAQKNMASLLAAKSSLFSVLPTLKARLEGMGKQDPAYLVQEYNNQYWQPVYSSQMLQVARGHKLEFMATATLPEVFDACYPKSILELINSEHDPVVRETIRDLGLSQSFRRDMYVKGGLRHWSGGKTKAILDQRFIVTGLAPEPEDEKGFEFKGGSLSLSGKKDAYQPLLDSFGISGSHLAEVKGKYPALDLATLVQKVTLLLHGGWLALEGRSSEKSAQRLNRELASASLLGAPYRYMCFPKLSISSAVSDLDFMMLGLLGQSVKPEELEEKLMHSMKILNKKFAEDGKPIEDETLLKAKAADVVKQFLQTKLKNYQRLGATESKH
jgi:SAM-dependent methyltransferase